MDSFLKVLENSITYYSLSLLDTSQISAFNLGTNLKEYKVDTQLSNSINNKQNTQPFFRCKIVQSRKQTQSSWNIHSMDLIFGLVGGFVSLIWMGTGMVIAPFEDFKF